MLQMYDWLYPQIISNFLLANSFTLLLHQNASNTTLSSSSSFFLHLLKERRTNEP